jgi:hypothetical protein
MKYKKIFKKFNILNQKKIIKNLDFFIFNKEFFY